MTAPALSHLRLPAPQPSGRPLTIAEQEERLSVAVSLLRSSSPSEPYTPPPTSAVPPAAVSTIWWEVALSWQAYALREAFRLYGAAATPGEIEDLQQAAIEGVYHAARRYRPGGTWTGCVRWGVRLALQTARHLQQGGGWLTTTDRVRLNRLLAQQAAHPQASLAEVAAGADLSVAGAENLLAAGSYTVSFTRLQGALDYGVLRRGTSSQHSRYDHAGIDPLLSRNRERAACSMQQDARCEDYLQAHKQRSALSDAIDALPLLERVLIIRRWGLDEEGVTGIRRLVRTTGLTESEVRATLARVEAHLGETLTQKGAPAYQRPSQWILDEAVYHAHTETFLRWSEVAEDFELDSDRAARERAERHARRHGLTTRSETDSRRCTTAIRVLNEECYTLAIDEGYGFEQAAALAGAADAATARRHARTYAHRASKPFEVA